MEGKKKLSARFHNNKFQMKVRERERGKKKKEKFGILLSTLKFVESEKGKKEKKT